MPDLTMYDLAPSPNNLKVRIALGYKGIRYEKIPVDPMDRSAVVEASGQPNTPVIRHGSMVLYDSGAILRYLDANFSDGPRLFAADRKAMYAIERWEDLGRRELYPAVAKAFAVFFRRAEMADCEAASARMHSGTERFEARLADREWLVGDAMTAADITTAPWVYYAMVPEKDRSKGIVQEFFGANLQLGPDRERTRDWVRRVLSFDR